MSTTYIFIIGFFFGNCISKPSECYCYKDDSTDNEKPHISNEEIGRSILGEKPIKKTDKKSTMKKIILFIILANLLVVRISAQHTIEVKHKYYTMQYDTTQYAELIGYYVQTKAHTKEIVDRKTAATFHQDPLIDPAYQVANDKEYSSWNAAHANKRRDKGHVNPYTAFAFAEDAAKESMFYTNTCPQVSFFNEHQWERVEQYVLKTVCPAYGDVQVWTGVLISKSHPKMMNDVPEPDYYWKVISYVKDGKTVEEAWLGLNDESNTSTDPADIVTDVAHLKKVILQYYPKLKLSF